MMKIPLRRSDLLRAIGIESARLSYPGSMSRGKSPVVKQGTKSIVENYFAEAFPMGEVWSSAHDIAGRYDDWHRERLAEIEEAIAKQVWAGNQPMSVAAKFLNTFMHQLMKYEPARPLFVALHLPLDSRVFAALRRERLPALSHIRNQLSESPYALRYDAHEQIQDVLTRFIDELNRRPGAEFAIRSRIELNWLWL